MAQTARAIAAPSSAHRQEAPAIKCFSPQLLHHTLCLPGSEPETAEDGAGMGTGTGHCSFSMINDTRLAEGGPGSFTQIPWSTETAAMQ